MRKIYIILFIHIVLMLLAASDFNFIPYVIKGKVVHFSYWEYSYRNGFGHTFYSFYSLSEVLTYIGAYAAGIILFAAVYHKGLRFSGSLGFGVCCLGLVSFLIEGFHWIFKYNMSLIASFPIILFVLWFIVMPYLFKISTHNLVTDQITKENLV